MNKKILLLEDDEELLNIVAFALKNENFSVFKAKNLEETYSIIKKENIDIIFADIILNDLKFTDYIDKIKELNKNIKIILTSAHNNLFPNNKNCLTFEKPYNIEKVIEKIKYLSMNNN